MPPGTLFVVATPIGNLEDITLRALRVLRESDVIAAEDTRRTAKLLAHHGISTPTLSFHEHNTRTRLPQLMERLQAGRRISLVTDAGTPGVSDPGVELVMGCRAKGIRVEPIPGPSAVLTAATASGFPLVPLTFLGFVPARSNDRSRWLTAISAINHTCVFFDGPTRIATTLREMARIMGDRQIVVARELTKVHEEFLAGTSAEVGDQLQSPRGEFTVVLGPSTAPALPADDTTDEAIADAFRQSTNNMQGSRREVIAALARRFGKSQREVYAAVERAKYSG